MPDTVVVHLLKISRFRGLEAMEWRPREGVNILIGGGDVGKSTILEALSLVFSPTNGTTISETDFWNRNADANFEIEAVISVPAGHGMETQPKLAWPWIWDGSKAVPPPMDQEGQPAGEPVHVVRVTGSPDLELTWEIIQPSHDAIPFSVGLRRSIGVIRLTSDDRNERDLRLVYGSALDRLFGDVSLRSRISQQFGDVDLGGVLGEEGSERLDKLDKAFAAGVLPSSLSMGITSSHGLSVGALIGLLAKKDDIDLPLASWGAGTRRLASLQIAAVNGSDVGLRLIDEIERGLEPYRLRQFLGSLQSDGHQSFITTHSPIAIEASSDSTLWYVDTTGKIGELSKAKIASQQKRDPETFLSRVAVLVEGDTEVGFLASIMDRVFGSAPLEHGVRISNGQGNDAVLSLLEGLTETRLAFAALVDNERRNPGRWQSLKAQMGDALLQWENGSTEEEVISRITDDQLPNLLRREGGQPHGDRLRTLAVRLGIEDKSLQAIQAAAADQETSLRALIISAATGDRADAPDDDGNAWKAHGRQWFKSVDGGRELLSVAQQLGAWPELEPIVRPLVNTILERAKLPRLERIEL